MLLLGVLMVAFMAAMASEASATLEIQSQNDPKGDPTPITYRFTAAGVPLVPDFALEDGAQRSFGPDPAKTGPQYGFQALVPAGWRVTSIVCKEVDPVTGAELPTRPGQFVIDVAAGIVTIDHRAGEDQYCAFTNSRVSASGGSAGTVPSTGVTPTVPGSAPRSLSRSPALLRVVAGRRFATATIRIPSRSVIKAQLLNGGRVVGSTRITRNAGTRTVRVSLTREEARRFQRQGRKRVTLTLRIVVVGSNRAAKVIRYRVILRL